MNARSICRNSFAALCFIGLFICLAFSTARQISPSSDREIAKLIHVIYPTDPPGARGELDFVNSWISTHPGYVIKIWTASETTTCFNKKSKRAILNRKALPHLWDLYQKETSPEIKLCLAAIEILFREGGICIAPKLVCARSLDGLFRSADLLIHQASSESFDLAASRPCHPFLSACLNAAKRASPKEMLQEFFLSTLSQPSSSQVLILPPDFILPKGSFQPIDVLKSYSDLGGFCFWEFETAPELTRLQKNELFFHANHMTPEEFHLLEQAKSIHPLLSRLIALLVLNCSLAACLVFSCKESLKNLLKCSKKTIAWGCAAACAIGVDAYLHAKHLKTLGLDNFTYLSSSNRKCSLNLHDLDFIRSCDGVLKKHLATSSIRSASETHIPKVFHVIGIGSKEISSKRLAGWLGHHPDWTMKFWTDTPPVFEELPKLSVHLIQNEPDLAGKSPARLRYDILAREGGVYIDSDLECLRSFDSLHPQLDFYAPIGTLDFASVSPSAFCTLDSSLIGSIPNHPILKQTVELLSQESPDRNDSTDVQLLKTSLLFTKAVKELFFRSDYNDLILPAVSIEASLLDEKTSPERLERLDQTGLRVANRSKAFSETFFSQDLSMQLNKTFLSIASLEKKNRYILLALATIYGWIRLRRRFSTQKII